MEANQHPSLLHTLSLRCIELVGGSKETIQFGSSTSIPGGSQVNEYKSNMWTYVNEAVLLGQDCGKANGNPLRT